MILLTVSSGGKVAERGEAGITPRSQVELRGNVCVRTPTHVGRAVGGGEHMHVWSKILANGNF